MTFNDKQKAVLIIGAVVIALMSAFPPWLYTSAWRGGGYSEKPAGHHFIARPPDPRKAHVSGVKLDITTYAVQFVIVLSVLAAAVTAAGIAGSRPPRTKSGSNTWAGELALRDAIDAVYALPMKQQFDVLGKYLALQKGIGRQTETPEKNAQMGSIFKRNASDDFNQTRSGKIPTFDRLVRLVASSETIPPPEFAENFAKSLALWLAGEWLESQGKRTPADEARLDELYQRAKLMDDAARSITERAAGPKGGAKHEPEGSAQGGEAANDEFEGSLTGNMPNMTKCKPLQIFDHEDYMAILVKEPPPIAKPSPFFSYVYAMGLFPPDQPIPVYYVTAEKTREGSVVLCTIDMTGKHQQLDRSGNWQDQEKFTEQALLILKEEVARRTAE